MISINLKVILALSALSGIFFGLVQNSIDAAAFFLGGVWGICNFMLIAAILQLFLIQKRTYGPMGILLIKFPLLYWAGYELLRSSWWNPWIPVLGFTASLGAFLLFSTVYSWRQA